MNAITVDRIDALLPQTQCTRCGYQGCRPYAHAIALGEAPINQCPPGGTAAIAALSILTGQPALPLNPVNGVESPRTVAYILEEHCIGCAKCLPACPVDAIVGAPKRMHTVIVSECTGCELCIAPCPVDCIIMVADTAGIRGQPRGPIEYAEAAHLRDRYEAHQARASRRRAEQELRVAAQHDQVAAAPVANSLADAIARAKTRKRR